MTLKQCEAECLKNCSCMAYSNSDIRKGGSGCLIWFGDLIDIREFTGDAATDIYIRMSASELGLDRKKEEDLDLPLFDLAIVASATNNFSKANMIGKGGFGPVYKGILSMGQEIAVKRLSNNSGQGLQEFKNEALELMDACLKDSCVESQVLRCIQVGLLCVQKCSADRPTMSSVVFMLGNEEAVLPQPKQPGFFVDSSSDGNGGRCQTENEVTVTRLEAR
ncbi:hypothetical protein AAG906_011721 [Vitis piasezkii]